MGWFSKKEPKTRLGRHFLSLGKFGILTAIAGVCCAGLLVLNLFAAVFWTSVQAEVRSIDQTCTLEFRSGSKKSKREGMDCKEAEAFKTISNVRGMSIKYEGVLTFAWEEADGRKRTAQVDDFGPSGDFKHVKTGDVAALRVSGGDDPWIHQPRSWKTTGGMLVFALFAFWLCWPSNPSKPSRWYVKPGPVFKLRRAIAPWATGCAALGFAALSMGVVLTAGTMVAEAGSTNVTAVVEQALVKWGGIAFGTSALLCLLVGLRRGKRFDLDAYVAAEVKARAGRGSAALAARRSPVSRRN